MPVLSFQKQKTKNKKTKNKNKNKNKKIERKIPGYEPGLPQPQPMHVGLVDKCFFGGCDGDPCLSKN
jgi:hypothetical protein